MSQTDTLARPKGVKRDENAAHEIARFMLDSRPHTVDTPHMSYDDYLARRTLAVNKAPIRRIHELAEHQPVFLHAQGQAAAVRANGGLRGSAATARRILERF
jgi:hypothetical protein